MIEYEEKIENISQSLKELTKKMKIVNEKIKNSKTKEEEKEVEKEKKELEKYRKQLYNKKKKYTEQNNSLEQTVANRHKQQILKKYINKIKKEDDYEEYYIRNGIIYGNFIKEHDKGHRPIQYIEADYFEELNLANHFNLDKSKISMSFFKWYLKKHCTTCDCEPCGCNKNSCNCEKYEIYDNDINLDFYDIVACSEQLKREDIKSLMLEYKDDTNKKKSQKNISNEYYYAKIEYFISPSRHKKIRYESYAIIYGNWAYLKPDGNLSRVQIKEKPQEYDNKILKKLYRRPDEMSKTLADSIINKLLKSHTNLKLAKPEK